MIEYNFDKWKIFKIKKLFHIHTGEDLILRNIKQGNIPIVSHTKENNGIVDYTDEIPNRKLFNSMKCIALADRGLFKASVQLKDFYIGGRVKCLELKYQKSNREILLFLATIINYEGFRFNYGRNATDRLPYLKIYLPVSFKNNGEYDPDWEYMENYIKNIKKITSKNLGKLKKIFEKRKDEKICTEFWKEFRINKLFIISRGKRFTEKDRISGTTEYYSASEFNNGLTDKISNPLFIEKNSIIYTTFGKSYYIENEFTGSDEISILKNRNLNKYNALFLVTIINQKRYKYVFGRKAFKNKFENEFIKLPAKLNEKNEYEPDWMYMENYIKNSTYAKYMK